MIITAKTKVKEALDARPELKEVLLELSPKFKKLNNPLIYKTVGKWATFGDVARIGNISICELLHTLNKAIGQEDELFRRFPDCIKELESETRPEEAPDWMERVKQFILFDVRERDDYFFPDVIKQLRRLTPNQALTVVNSFDPVPLKKAAEEMGFKHHTEKVSDWEYRVHFHSDKPPARDVSRWKEYKEEFEILDVRGWKEDPFSEILKKANQTALGEGFRLIQMFEPIPLINMLKPLGFDHHTEQVSQFRYHIYFCKTRETAPSYSVGADGKIPLVIQSATPVVYPVLMRLLQSPRLMERVKIEELKVWYETEKHMSWIVNGKADISFSAVVAIAKLFLNKADIKLASIDVWDNFYLLTRGYRANSFADLKGHTIHLPLFRAAPPFAVTSYLMKKMGYNPDDFQFEFGKPFGRPEIMKNQFIRGEIDTVLLREPEASFALAGAGKDAYVSLSYSELWKQVQPDFDRLPNAGVVFKGEFLRNHPDVARLFLKELEAAIQWVNENPRQAAELSYDIMGQSPENVELFLKRVNFHHQSAAEAKNRILQYVQVLHQEGVIKLKGGSEDLDDLFRFEIETGSEERKEEIPE